MRYYLVPRRGNNPEKAERSCFADVTLRQSLLPILFDFDGWNLGFFFSSGCTIWVCIEVHWADMDRG